MRAIALAAERSCLPLRAIGTLNRSLEPDKARMDAFSPPSGSWSNQLVLQSRNRRRAEPDEAARPRGQGLRTLNWPRVITRNTQLMTLAVDASGPRSSTWCFRTSASNLRRAGDTATQSHLRMKSTVGRSLGYQPKKHLVCARRMEVLPSLLPVRRLKEGAGRSVGQHAGSWRTRTNKDAKNPLDRRHSRRCDLWRCGKVKRP